MIREKQEVEKIEIMPSVSVPAGSLEWFIGNMFNPESNIWVWVRRIGDISSMITVILLVVVLVTLNG